MKWFDTKTRAARILTLLERKLEYTPEQLSDKLGVSRRTIANEINRLNQELGTSARIEFQKGVYHLYLFEIPEFVKIRDRITKPTQDFDNRSNRLAYIVNSLIHQPDYVLSDDLAFEMSISRTTLNKDINELKNLLRHYQIEIVGRPNRGLKLEGSEFNIRRFLIDRVFKILFKPEELDADIWVNFNEVMESYQLERGTIEMVSRYFRVGLDRYLNGNPITFNESYFYSLPDEKYYEVSQQIHDRLKKSLGIDLPNEELIFITLPLLGMRTPVDLSTVESFITIDKEAIELADKIIDDIKVETDLVFQFDDSLDEFIYHLIFLINRLKYRVFLENPLKYEMQRRYSLAWKIAERTAKTIQDTLNIKVSDDEIGFLSSYFEVALREQELRNKRNFRVLVIHEKGGAAMRLIGIQLKKILSPEVEIEMRTFRSKSKTDLEDFDLIITTGTINADLKTPVIELDEIVDEEVLKQQIERIQYIHSLNIPSKNSGHSVLLTLLDEDKVFIFDEDVTYTQVLEILAQAMVDQNLADADFPKRLMFREEQQSMRFSEHMAFPHSFHSKNDKPFAAIALLPNNLKQEGYEDLEVVILAGLPKETENDLTLVQLYEEIVKISDNKKIVDELSQLNSYWDILSYFIVKEPIFDS